MEKRFRGYLPVIVDIETAGFNAKKNALLEIAAVIVELNLDGELAITERYMTHVVPFKNSELDEAALKFNGIDPAFGPALIIILGFSSILYASSIIFSNVSDLSIPPFPTRYAQSLG